MDAALYLQVLKESYNLDLLDSLLLIQSKFNVDYEHVFLYSPMGNTYIKVHPSSQRIENKVLFLLSADKICGVERLSSHLNMEVSSSPQGVCLYRKDGRKLGFAKLSIQKSIGPMICELIALIIENIIQEYAIKDLTIRSAVQMEVLKYQINLDQVGDIIWNTSTTNSFNNPDMEIEKSQLFQVLFAVFDELKMFSIFSIDQERFKLFLFALSKLYRDKLPYHNFTHAVGVCHQMYIFISNCPQLRSMLSSFDILALLIACIIHDLDHRGTTNAFIAKHNSNLSKLYLGSYLENHHFDLGWELLCDSTFNFLPNLPVEDKSLLRSKVKALLIATDLGETGFWLPKLIRITKGKTLSMSNCQHKDLICNLLISCADLNAFCKPLQQSITRTLDVYKELEVVSYLEASLASNTIKDLELDSVILMKQSKSEPPPKLDISKQLEFMNHFCLPKFTLLIDIFPSLNEVVLKYVIKVRDEWERRK